MPHRSAPAASPTGAEPFVLVEDSPLSPEVAWARVTDWEAHARFVPLTRITVTTPAPTGPGTSFTARTAVGRFGFDDVMEVVAWEPPGHGSEIGRCRLEKRGRAMAGWAEITVAAGPGGGSRTTWTEVARPRGVPAFADPVNARVGRVLFGRVLRRLLAP